VADRRPRGRVLDEAPLAQVAGLRTVVGRDGLGDLVPDGVDHAVGGRVVVRAGRGGVLAAVHAVRRIADERVLRRLGRGGGRAVPAAGPGAESGARGRRRADVGVADDHVDAVLVDGPEALDDRSDLGRIERVALRLGEGSIGDTADVAGWRFAVAV